MFCETILFMWAPLSLNNTLPFMILIIKHLSDSIRPSVHLFRHRLGPAQRRSGGNLPRPGQIWFGCLLLLLWLPPTEPCQLLCY